MFITRSTMVVLLILIMGNWINGGLTIDVKLTIIGFMILGAIVEAVVELKKALQGEEER